MLFIINSAKNTYSLLTVLRKLFIINCAKHKFIINSAKNTIYY